MNLACLVRWSSNSPDGYEEGHLQGLWTGWYKLCYRDWSLPSVYTLFWCNMPHLPQSGASDKPWYEEDVDPAQWFSTGSYCAPGGHQATSGDILGCHNWGGGGGPLTPSGFGPGELLNMLPGTAHHPRGEQPHSAGRWCRSSEPRARFLPDLCLRDGAYYGLSPRVYPQSGSEVDSKWPTGEQGMILRHTAEVFCKDTIFGNTFKNRVFMIIEHWFSRVCTVTDNVTFWIFSTMTPQPHNLQATSRVTQISREVKEGSQVVESCTLHEPEVLCYWQGVTVGGEAVREIWKEDTVRLGGRHWLCKELWMQTVATHCDNKRLCCPPSAGHLQFPGGQFLGCCHHWEGVPFWCF